MNVQRTQRSDPEFYALLGPVFGSRQVERATRDRFYDDPGKVWFVTEGGAASVLEGSIRNFWAEDDARARALLTAMLAEFPRLTGVVPRGCAAAFEALGFETTPYKKNFIEVSYEKD